MGAAGNIPKSRIVGTGRYLPEKVLTNFELEKLVDTSNDWIIERTGIRERHVAADHEASSDMASEAARRALKSAGITAKDIDLIIVSTVTPDMPLPATAMFVQQNIGARPDCPGFDLSAACAGFIYGLSLADSMIKSGSAKYVLLCGVELLTRVMNWKDRTTCVLFGDGAGAVVVGPAADDGRGILSTHLYADGSLASALCIPAGGSRLPNTPGTLEQGKHLVHMVGKDVFKFAVKALASASNTAIEHNGLRAQDIHRVVPHQANIRIIEGVSKRCGIPMERFFINIDRIGNTSSASIPIALDEALEAGAIEPGNNIVFCALGGGIAWGSALVRW